VAVALAAAVALAVVFTFDAVLSPLPSTRWAVASSTDEEDALTSRPAAFSRASTSLAGSPRSLAISCTRLFISQPV